MYFSPYFIITNFRHTVTLIEFYSWCPSHHHLDSISNILIMSVFSCICQFIPLCMYESILFSTHFRVSCKHPYTSSKYFRVQIIKQSSDLLIILLHVEFTDSDMWRLTSSTKRYPYQERGSRAPWSPPVHLLVDASSLPLGDTHYSV